jgi:tetratricopeptide (TPR) repeat protein
MVASLDNQLEESKKIFESGDISNTIESLDEILSGLSKNDDQAKYIHFLKDILEHCRQKQLKEEEALILRALGRTHSIFDQHFESLNYHRESLKLQRKLGRKADIAQGLVMLGEDLEIAGEYNDSLGAFKSAYEVFYDLGKRRKAKEIKNQIARLQEFSRQMAEDEFYLNKFHIDKL